MHGNANKSEVSPDGSKDENVFDIKQGVAIIIGILKDKQSGLANVFYTDVYGSREIKYKWLFENSISLLNKIEISPPPHYIMLPTKYDEKISYNNGFELSKLFMKYNVGVVTARDNFCLTTKREALLSNIEDLCKLDIETIREKYHLGKDTRDWKIEYAKADTINDFKNDTVADGIIQYLYRPFDVRYTYYTGNSKGFHCMPRGSIMQHLLTSNNVALICNKTQKNKNGFPVFISQFVVDYHILETANANAYVMPLNTAINNVTETKYSNYNMDIIHIIEEKLGLQFSAEKENVSVFSPIDLLDYIYAVLYSPRYREKYKEFLKIDFPRVPYPTDKETFWKLVEIGSELRKCHLMQTEFDVSAYSFIDDGTNEVIKPEYKNGRVYINKTQYFDNVPQAQWEQYIGGYQPLQKWLKDRKKTKLSADDIEHYKKIIAALKRTEELMKEIDKIVEF